MPFGARLRRIGVGAVPETDGHFLNLHDRFQVRARRSSCRLKRSRWQRHDTGLNIVLTYMIGRCATRRWQRKALQMPRLRRLVHLSKQACVAA